MTAGAFPVLYRYADWIALVAVFTVDSFTHWEWAANSVRCLLSRRDHGWTWHLGEAGRESRRGGLVPAGTLLIGPLPTLALVAARREHALPEGRHPVPPRGLRAEGHHRLHHLADGDGGGAAGGRRRRRRWRRRPRRRRPANRAAGHLTRPLPIPAAAGVHLPSISALSPLYLPCTSAGLVLPRLVIRALGAALRRCPCTACL